MEYEGELEIKKATRPSSDLWRDLIEQAVRYKEKFGKSKDWQVYRRWYRGDFPGYNRTASGTLPYNLIYSMSRAVIPNTYFRNPYLTASPRMMPGMEIHAKVVESVANWLIQELDIKHIMKSIILDTYLCGRGIAKVGYDSEFGFAPKDLVDQTETMTNVDKAGRQYLEYNTNIRPGMPWVQRVDPDLFLVPFGVRNLEEAEWATHVIIRQLNDLKKDIKYKNVRDLTGTHIDKTLVLKNKQEYFDELAKHIEWLEYYEIRDKKREELLCVAPQGTANALIRGPLDDSLQIEGLPFVDLCFNEDPEFYWCPSDAKIIEPQQVEMNEANSQAQRHREITLLKFLYDQNRMTKDELDKFLSGEAGVAAGVDGPPAEVIMALQPHMPPDLISWFQKERDDVRELTGFGRNQSGAEMSSSRRTATEAQLVQQGHDIRMGERQDAVADTLQKIMRKVMQTAFKFWDGNKVAQVVGYDGARYWVEYTPEMIKGEYNLKVDVESMTRQSKALRRKDLIQLIQALAQNPRANLDYLLRTLLREFEWIDAMKVLPEAPEMQSGQAMPYDQYQQKQQGMLDNPEVLKERVGITAGNLGMIEGGMA